MKSSLRSSPIPLTDFSLAVIALVKKIPRGKVATYSQIARLAGKPHAARGVGWILNSCTKKFNLPWQRVLNSRGMISFSPKTKEYREQKKLLQAEGVKFTTSHGLDLAVYQWKKDARTRRHSPRTPTMFN